MELQVLRGNFYLLLSPNFFIFIHQQANFIIFSILLFHEWVALIIQALYRDLSSNFHFVFLVSVWLLEDKALGTKTGKGAQVGCSCHYYLVSSILFRFASEIFLIYLFFQAQLCISVEGGGQLYFIQHFSVFKFCIRRDLTFYAIVLILNIYAIPLHVKQTRRKNFFFYLVSRLTECWSVFVRWPCVIWSWGTARVKGSSSTWGQGWWTMVFSLILLLSVHWEHGGLHMCVFMWIYG